MTKTASEFKKDVSIVLNKLKFEFKYRQQELIIPVYMEGKLAAHLRPVSQELERDAFYIKLLADWRAANEKAYPTVFKVTLDGTRKWIREQLICREDRILFIVLSVDNQPIGHLGLSNFDFLNKIAEIDNVIRGVNGVLQGIMTASLNTMNQWAFNKLGMRKLFLRVFYDNKRAIKFYERCGFKDIKKIPLHKTIECDIIKYEEIPEGGKMSVDRVFLLMEVNNNG